MYKKILCISDLHAPFQHVDTVPFLKKILDEFNIKPRRKDTAIVLLGDEVTGNAISFHEKDPDALFTPATELEAAIEALAPLHEMLPGAFVIDSNHGSLVYRRRKWAGLPRHVIKPYNEILGCTNWNWTKDLLLPMSNGQTVFFTHGKSARENALSKSVGTNTVQGHYHTKRTITYWRGTHEGDKREYFSMIPGCMIDNDAYDFNYNKTNLDDVLLGHGIIIDGVPRLLPMFLNEKKRWNKKLCY